MGILKYLRKKAEGNTADTAGTADHVIEQITEAEKEEPVEDYELVAVITAAICASMKDAVPADGFIVRSIRKRGGRRRIYL